MMEASSAKGLNQTASKPEPQEKERGNPSIADLQPQRRRQQQAQSIWHPNDWSYAAEGGKHALFRYAGTACDISGHLLRITKNDLAKSSSVHAENEGEDSTASFSRTCKVIEFMEEPASQSFHRKIVQPLLGHCYLDLARLVRLPASCCAQLYHRTLASGSIPPSRLPTWKWKVDDGTKSDKIDPIVQECVKATLLRDHTHLSPHPRLLPPASPTSVTFIDSCKQAKDISVEIKPKAGYITSSPLVLPGHRCKYFRTRYSMQQELMQKGHVQKGWRIVQEGKEERRQSAENTKVHHGTFAPSNYSPLDLFSGNAIQVQKALTDLSQNMQNNFRVWRNGRQIFGEDETPSENDCQTMLDDLFNKSGIGVYSSDPKSTLLDVITKTVSRVLDRESLLSNMLSMQQLDVIDGDGAVKVYERLVHLCEGSNDEAELILDEAALIALDGFALGQRAFTASSSSHSSSDSLFASSPYTIPTCNSLDILLNEIAQFQTLLHACIQEGKSPDEEIMNASHAKCIECVNQLSKEACIYLLQNWLLSLALCDVSFFVTFRVLKDREVESIKEECQSREHGGLALCSIQDGAPASHAMAVHYEVKIVDCDPKPANKLRERGEVESKFQFINE
ncbi:hypothetical protein ACHAXR_009733 [Thalassiosira sp. AJA248-18]